VTEKGQRPSYIPLAVGTPRGFALSTASGSIQRLRGGTDGGGPPSARLTDSLPSSTIQSARWTSGRISRQQIGQRSGGSGRVCLTTALHVGHRKVAIANPPMCDSHARDHVRPPRAIPRVALVTSGGTLRVAITAPPTLRLFNTQRQGPTQLKSRWERAQW
jgi:hypothetical protein